LVTLVVCSGAGYYANKASLTWSTQVPKKHSDHEILALRVFGYFLWCLGGLFFLTVIGLRKRILLAIGIIKQSSKALSSMPLLTLLPVFQCAAIVLFVLIWMIYAANLASLGEFVPVKMEMNNITITFRSYQYDDPLQYAAWYLLFCFFWTTQFILALGEIIAAMSVAKWYFSRDRSGIGNWTVIQCFCQSLLYHAGTAAFGSLIIAVVETISAFLAYLQRRINMMGSQGATASKVAEVILCCLQCMMCCLENFLKYMNKNAYIHVAIFGSNLCCSAREAFFLILRNAARVGALTILCGVVAFIGKFFIALVTGGISYVILDQYVPLELTNPAGPAILITIVAYFIGSSFMSILSMAVNTMLHCYVVDKEVRRMLAS
jgi:choline transporter-like protein 2/4/5